RLTAGHARAFKGSRSAPGATEEDLVPNASPPSRRRARLSSLTRRIARLAPRAGLAACVAAAACGDAGPATPEPGTLEPFGDETLYVALLAVPPFTPADARGAERIAVGIPGLPLLP
ncbi:MAG: hypothetical protein AB1689_18480, partial [Thermodesulfobacteriota bacterium]